MPRRNGALPRLSRSLPRREAGHRWPGFRVPAHRHPGLPDDERMTTEEWRAAVAADRPPLTEAQLAILRPIWRPAAPHIKDAPRAPTEAEANADARQRY
jgi:hypothetical protein